MSELPAPGPLRLPGRVMDAALAVTAVAVTAAAAVAAPQLSYQATARAPDALAYVLIAAGGAALLLGRTRPPLAVALATAAALAYHAAGYVYAPVSTAVVLAVYGLTLRDGWRRGAVAAVAAVGAVVAARVVWGGLPLGWGLHGYALAGAAAVAGGTAARLRRDYALAAERHRAGELRRHADEERLRIARDVHDVVAHSLGVITVQAGVAAHLLDTRPEHARQALEAIADAGRQALGDLRDTLNVLRADGEGAPRAPAPGLAALGTLLDSAARSGVAVEVRGDLAPTALPAPVDMAAYRILQEALTNVARHAGTERATVRLSQDAGDLLVEVVDDGAGAPAGVRGGLGISGMHERARAVGGTLEAGTRAGGGFRVLARLPV